MTNEHYFDAFVTIGRTNRALGDCPRSALDVLHLMDNYDISDAMVINTVSLDSDSELGNAAIDNINNDRLHKLWAFDTSIIIKETPSAFLKRALDKNIKGIVVSPTLSGININYSPRLTELALVLQERKIPLFFTCDQFYEVAQFCQKFPELPVIVRDWRTRANRPLFDALATTTNLRITIASLWQAQILSEISASFSSKRLVFSLGQPYLDPRACITALRYSEITPEQKADISFANITSILSEANYA